MTAITGNYVHDLTLLYLKNTVDFKDISPEDLAKKYLDVYNEIDRTSIERDVNTVIKERGHALY